MSERHHSWIACAIAIGMLCLLMVVAYATSYRGTFVYDDGICLVECEGIDQWWPAKLSNFTTGRRRWLTHVTFVANYKAGGQHVFGYHLVNNLIHLAAACTLFGLVRRVLLLPATKERFSRSATWVAFAVAALWLVHPLQTESVTYIVQRLESLAGLLMLLCLYFVLRGNEGRYSWIWYSLGVMTVWLGTGSKETMFLAPLVILLFDRTYLASTWKEVWSRRWALHAAMLPTIIWSAYQLKGSFTPGTRSSMGFGFKGVTPWQYLRTQPEVILHYLRLSFWPDEQCLDYGWLVQNDPTVYLSLGAVVLSLVIAALALCWYRPRIGFVAFMFFFILAPTSSFMPIRDLAFEHRMYLPLACVILLVVLAVHQLCQQTLKKRVPRLGIQSLLLFLAVGGLTLRTSQRNHLYHDPVNVWREVTQRSPWNTRATYNLGLMLLQRGLVPGGEPEYHRLLLTNSKQLHVIGNQNREVKIEGDIAEAAKYFHKTLELDAKDASAHFNLGGIYDRAGEIDIAVQHYQSALRYQRSHTTARVQLTKLLQKQGNYELATKHALKGIQYAPEDARAYIAYGKLLAAQGKAEEAIAQFQKALEIKADHHSARYQMALALWKLDRQSDAIAQLRETRRRNRGLTDVNLSLARFLVVANDTAIRHPAESAAIAEAIIASDKNHLAPAYEVLAMAQLELRRADLAASSIEKGLQIARSSQDDAMVAALEALRERLPQPVSVIHRDSATATSKAP